MKRQVSKTLKKGCHFRDKETSFQLLPTVSSSPCSVTSELRVTGITCLKAPLQLIWEVEAPRAIHKRKIPRTTTTIIHCSLGPKQHLIPPLSIRECGCQRIHKKPGFTTLSREGGSLSKVQSTCRRYLRSFRQLGLSLTNRD